MIFLVWARNNRLWLKIMPCSQEVSLILICFPPMVSEGCWSHLLLLEQVKNWQPSHLPAFCKLRFHLWLQSQTLLTSNWTAATASFVLCAFIRMKTSSANRAIAASFGKYQRGHCCRIRIVMAPTCCKNPDNPSCLICF